MKIVGQVTIMNGDIEDIIECQVWVMRNDKPTEITIRVTPDCYGGMPGRSEVRDGKLVGLFLMERTFSSREELINHYTKEFTEAKKRLQESSRAINKKLRDLK